MGEKENKILESIMRSSDPVDQSYQEIIKRTGMPINMLPEDVLRRHRG